MNLLITGGTGFVGNVLLGLLPEAVRYSRIILFSPPGDPNRKLAFSRGLRDLEVIEGDITVENDILRAVEKATHVIHLAGLISYWKRDRDRLFAINRRGVENLVRACLRFDVRRLVHVSSVGAIGFHRNGEPADERTPFNWPSDFHYMTSKRAGQKIVEEAVRDHGLRAVILNPASVMGPGDPTFSSPHNQLYRSICDRALFGSFSGGLAVVDVRDLAQIVVKALHAGEIGERYLVVGANVRYTDVVKAIGGCCGRKVYPIPVPPVLVAAAGWVLELIGGITGKRPALTRSYGRLSGWYGYYENAKSVKAFGHEYIDFERTVADSCEYYKRTFRRSRTED